MASAIKVEMFCDSAWLIVVLFDCILADSFIILIDLARSFIEVSCCFMVSFCLSIRLISFVISSCCLFINVCAFFIVSFSVSMVVCLLCKSVICEDCWVCVRNSCVCCLAKASA